MCRKWAIALCVWSVAFVGCHRGEAADLAKEVISLRRENDALRKENQRLKEELAAQKSRAAKVSAPTRVEIRPVSHTSSLYDQGILRFPEEVERAMMGDAMRGPTRFMRGPTRFMRGPTRFMQRDEMVEARRIEIELLPNKVIVPTLPGPHLPKGNR